MIPYLKYFSVEQGFFYHAQNWMLKFDDCEYRKQKNKITIKEDVIIIE